MYGKIRLGMNQCRVWLEMLVQKGTQDSSRKIWHYIEFGVDPRNTKFARYPANEQILSWCGVVYPVADYVDRRRVRCI